MIKLVFLALLAGGAWAAWGSRDDLRRYLRMRAM